MAESAHILIADNRDGRKFLTEALQGYELFTAGTLKEAVRLLMEDGFDLIICNIHFDDSHMIDLFYQMQKDPRHKKTSFIAFRDSHSNNKEMLRQSVATMQKTFGIGPYIELDAYAQSPNPAAAARAAIEECLPKDKIVAAEGR